MKTKPVLCPERLRHVPRQFSWIDQRLVRDRHLKGRTPRALALYLFLCTVADAQGASYYSDATTGSMLSFSPEELWERGLSFGQIARELGLDPETVAKYARAAAARKGRANSTPSSRRSTAGWSGIPTVPRKSSSVCVPRKAIRAGSAS